MPTGHYQRQRRVQYVQLVCERCVKQFEVSPGVMRKRKRIRYCSWECLKGPQGEYAERICGFCHAQFSILISHAKYGYGKFCTRACFTESRKRADAKWRDKTAIKRYMQDYQERNREALNRRARERNASKPEQARERRKRWNKKNKPRLAILAGIRRTRKVGAGGSFTVEEWEALKMRYGFACLACDQKEPDIKLTADHVISVAKGGTSNIDNIQPLCQPCNTRKGKKCIDYRPLMLN